MPRTRIVILGAAGRDFHNFNVLYRDHPAYEVVAFTATQIPDIAGRKYPSTLAGKLYPKGIPIFAEEQLASLIRTKSIDEVVFSYSDVSYAHVMGRAAIANAAGAHFKVLSAASTMIRSKKPVISVCAVRTGSGKSQTTRRVADICKQYGLKVAAIRHPMPYGDLAKQRVQRFHTLADLKKHKCTIEEVEEYEPHIVNHTIIYAGVDYEAILRQAEKEADIILWDGGNNDTPFYVPDVHIVVADPLRAGHELSYYPGETNLRMADVVVINKADTAGAASVNLLRRNILAVNPKAEIVEAASPLILDHVDRIRNHKALVVEDGPTLTHGEMTTGAGTVAAEKYGASEIIDPRPYTTGRIAETFRKYPKIGHLLPAMGYGKQQTKDLERTINRVPCDVVVIGTPIDLNRIIRIRKPTVRVRYDLQEIGSVTLETILRPFLTKLRRRR